MSVTIIVDVLVREEAITVFGEEAAEGNVSDGVMWFRNKRGAIGLSMVIVERMRWEEERVGWVKEGEESEGEESGGVHQEGVKRGLEEVWLLCVGGEVCAEENGWKRVCSNCLNDPDVGRWCAVRGEDGVQEGRVDEVIVRRPQNTGVTVKLMVMVEKLNFDNVRALHYAMENFSQEMVKALLELEAANVKCLARPTGKT
ncbi:hypothetical protein NL676_032177 [Syzygium grande]|nr:hypothetical protein NL676_032177 [Syzygium grande]